LIKYSLHVFSGNFWHNKQLLEIYYHTIAIGADIKGFACQRPNLIYSRALDSYPCKPASAPQKLFKLLLQRSRTFSIRSSSFSLVSKTQRLFSSILPLLRVL
jgi:hypothetical protein